MKNFHLWGFCLVGLLSISSCAQLSQSKAPREELSDAQNLNELKLELAVEKMVLPNGLRVILLEDKKLPIYSYYTFYDVGGRYESKGTTGATHFLEHMMFKGSKNYPPGSFDRFIESAGGNNNAYTSFDSTVYYQNMPSHTLEEMIKIEADRMKSVLLIPEAFESERLVILEERKMRYENSPRGQLFQAMMKAVFEGTPYGGSVIGEEEDILGLDRDRMLEFHKTFYAPNNAVIVIVGDFETSRTKKWIKDAFGGIEENKELASLKASHNSADAYTHRGRYKREIRVHGQAQRPMFMMAYKGEKLGERRAFVMDILSSMLGSGESSYLHQEYVQTTRPVLSSISAGNYNLKYSGVFFLSGELLEKTSLPQFQKRLLRDSLSFCDKGLDERALQKTKNQYLVGYYNEIEANAGLASFLGDRENFFGDYAYYEKELEMYTSITLDEVQKTCRELFLDQEQIFVSVWDKHPKPKKKNEDK